MSDRCYYYILLDHPIATSVQRMFFVIVESAECDHYRFHVATRNGAIPEREILQSAIVRDKKVFSLSSRYCVKV